jgi:membrane protease YdiL (CAAX protease family)
MVGMENNIIKESLMKNKNAILRCLFVLFLFCVPSYLAAFKIYLSSDGNIFLSNYSFTLDYKTALISFIQVFQYGLPIIILMILTNDSFEEYGFNKVSLIDLLKSLLRMFGLTLLFLIAFGIIVGLLFYKKMDSENIFMSLEKENNTTLMILLNLVPIILLAFIEELYFRSFLYKNLNKIIEKKWICIIIVNILFGIGHIYQGIIAMFGTFIIGMVLSIEFKKHNNIYTISIFHALRNVMAFVLRSIL